MIYQAADTAGRPPWMRRFWILSKLVCTVVLVWLSITSISIIVKWWTQRNDVTHVCACCCAGAAVVRTLTTKQHGPPNSRTAITCQSWSLELWSWWYLADGPRVHEWCRLSFSPSRRVWQRQEEKTGPFAVATVRVRVGAAVDRARTLATWTVNRLPFVVHQPVYTGFCASNKQHCVLHSDPDSDIDSEAPYSVAQPTLAVNLYAHCSTYCRYPELKPGSRRRKRARTLWVWTETRALPTLNW